MSESYEWPDDPAERAQELVEGVLDELDLDGDVVVEEDDERILLTIEGEDDYGLLIGKRGQTIDALQLLCYQAAFRGLRERKRVIVDAAGYRARRRETLEGRADRAAEQALEQQSRGRDGPDERPGKARRPRTAERALGHRDLQRGRRAQPLRDRRAAADRVSADPAAGLDGAARAQLETVLALLAEERASVSSVVDERAWQVHVVDSLTGLEVPELRSAQRIADVGAGAGFPGLVLAVALPGAQVDLVESVGRKCEFMRQAIAAAGIANATVLNTRSEDLACRGRPGGLRRRHRPRGGPPLDPRRARIPASEAKWRPRRLEGQA